MDTHAAGSSIARSARVWRCKSCRAGAGTVQAHRWVGGKVPHALQSTKLIALLAAVAAVTPR